MVTFIVRKYYSQVYKPLMVRNNTTDNEVFKTIFVLNELKLPIKVTPKFIIDAGAYTGLSSLYYFSKYPNAKIYAIEPEDSNFEILTKHTEKLPNITRIKAGLWHKNSHLRIIDTNAGKWGFQVKEVKTSENYNVKAITVGALLKMSGFARIDILKIDIEGSEKELFSMNCNSWIDRVNIVVIELHDHIREGCSRAFYSAINKNVWMEYKKGEKVILIRRKHS